MYAFHVFCLCSLLILKGFLLSFTHKIPANCNYFPCINNNFYYGSNSHDLLLLLPQSIFNFAEIIYIIWNYIHMYIHIHNEIKRERAFSSESDVCGNLYLSQLSCYRVMSLSPIQTTVDIVLLGWRLDLADGILEVILLALEWCTNFMKKKNWSLVRNISSHSFPVGAFSFDRVNSKVSLRDSGVGCTRGGKGHEHQGSSLP